MNGTVIHFIGIGGTGMNGVARLTAHAGYTVSGSDRAADPGVSRNLENLGIRIVPQDGSGISSPGTDFVVYSTAIEADNPDLRKAKALNIPLLHRADMLAKLCEGRELIAIAGSAGKSTVTGLLGWIFDQLGKDPTVYCGASMNNFGSPVRYGAGPWIIEADESDRSFLKFHPDHAIITNIAEDHFPLAELERLFFRFESQVSGTVVKTPSALPPFQSPLLGKHNIENIRHALTFCKALGLDLPKCLEAVRSFNGIERRLERVGPGVIDDFAHSPVKIAAALQAVSGVFPAFSACWRPHGYTPLFQGASGFLETFADHWKDRPRDKLFLLPVYFAGGTVERKVSSEQFVEQLKTADVPAEFVPDFETLKNRLMEEGLPVLIMGARDPELPRFAKRIAELIR